MEDDEVPQNDAGLSGEPMDVTGGAREISSLDDDGKVTATDGRPDVPVIIEVTREESTA